MFTERELRKGLNTKAFGNRVFTFEKIDSTNNCARALANVGKEEGIVVIAEEQTAGKGRLGRSWEANRGENLTFSILLRPKVSPEAINLLPLSVGVAIAEAIERLTRLKVECKWPNDLLLNGKKVAGILMESSMKENTVDFVVVGVGLNVNQTQFSPNLQARATSLKLESKQEIDRARLFKEILASLEANYYAGLKTEFKSVMSSWLRRTPMLNKPIVISQQGTIISGFVRGLSPDGGLVLQTNGTEKTLYAGDVTILGDSQAKQSLDTHTP
jgi:BirA family biotin operon repressor/biotin-[acetyl-CoA-carboxylase] ligase